jgi:hypothetical protein
MEGWAHALVAGQAQTFTAMAWLAAEKMQAAPAPRGCQRAELLLVLEAAKLRAAGQQRAVCLAKRPRTALEYIREEHLQDLEPWAVEGLHPSWGIGAPAWKRLVVEWAQPLLASFAEVPQPLLSAFAKAYLPQRPPVAFAPWVLLKAVERLRGSVSPWDRTDGAALSLALLKDLGDAMMKKMDVTNPKRPGAQQTQQARVEIYGSPGSATATLPLRLELVRSVGNVRPELPMDQARHLIASALVPEAAEERAFSSCVRRASEAESELLACTDALEEAGFPRWEGLLAAATFAARNIKRSNAELTAALAAMRQWGWLELVKVALEHHRDVEPNEDARAEIAKSLQDVSEARSWAEIRKRGARRAREDLFLGKWHWVVSARPRPHECPAEREAPEAAETRETDQSGDEELPLIQMGALPGETILCGLRTFVVETGSIAASLSACRERGLGAATTGVQTTSGPARFLGQTCDCGQRSCLCPAASLREGQARGTWRDLVLPRAHECRWKQPGRKTPHDGEERLAALLAAVPPGLRSDAGKTARALCRSLSKPKDVLTETERRCWWRAVRALEAELLGTSAAHLRRKCALLPRDVLEYWRNEQAHLAPTATRQSSAYLPLPPELAGLTEETRCPCPGCPGTLLEAERFVRSVDEESLSVLRCCHPACGYLARKA